MSFNKNRMICLLIMMSFSSQGFARQIAPKKCPSVKAIQSTTTWIQKELGSSYYFAIQENKEYDAGWKDGTWTFQANYIHAASMEQAGRVAYRAIKTLVYNAGPIKKNDNAWYCVYTNSANNVDTRAITDY